MVRTTNSCQTLSLKFFHCKTGQLQEKTKTDNVNLILSATKDFLEIIWYNNISHIQLSDLYNQNIYREVLYIEHCKTYHPFNFIHHQSPRNLDAKFSQTISGRATCYVSCGRHTKFFGIFMPVFRVL